MRFLDFRRRSKSRQARPQSPPPPPVPPKTPPSSALKPGSPVAYVTPPPRPLTQRYVTKIDLARCTSLDSIDTMAAALALRPSQIGQYDPECPETPRRPIKPKEKSPPTPILVRTFGPTELRSNIQYQRRVKSEKIQSRRHQNTAQSATTRTRRPSLVANAIANAAAAAIANQEVAVPSIVATAVNETDSVPMLDKSADVPPSPVPSNLVTPLNLTPVEEVTVYFPDTESSIDTPRPSSDHPIIHDAHQVSPTENTLKDSGLARSSGTNAIIALLPSLSSLYPSSSPVASPTGSTFNGDRGPTSPTFSNFKFGINDEFKTPRPWSSMFAYQVRARSNTIAVDDNPGWTAGNVFGESVVLLDSPTSRGTPASPVFRSSLPTLTRLAERRPIALDLSSARRRPRHLTQPCSSLLSPSSSTSVTFKDLGLSIASSSTSTAKGSLSTAQDSNMIASILAQVDLNTVTSTRPVLDDPVSFVPSPPVNSLEELKSWSLLP